MRNSTHPEKGCGSGWVLKVWECRLRNASVAVSVSMARVSE